MLGPAPKPTAAPENSLDFDATWAWTSSPITTSQGPVRPSTVLDASVMPLPYTATGGAGRAVATTKALNTERKSSSSTDSKSDWNGFGERSVFKVLTCIGGQHDLRLVVVAGLICIAVSFTVFRLFGQARARAPGERVPWLAFTALAAGVGVWATHFVAMLAYAPSLTSGYELGGTIASLILSIAGSALGFGLASAARSPGPSRRSTGSAKRWSRRAHSRWSRRARRLAWRRSGWPRPRRRPPGR